MATGSDHAAQTWRTQRRAKPENATVAGVLVRRDDRFTLPDTARPKTGRHSLANATLRRAARKAQS